MIVALLGGTGNLGRGLALRLSLLGYDVVVGSRSAEKAAKIAAEYASVSGANVRGVTNREAAKLCDVAIFTIPWRHAFAIAELLRDELKDKVVVSPLVPMEKKGENFTYIRLPEGSAAEKLASILDSRVAAAFHCVPAARFANLEEKVDWDLPVCGDEEAKDVVVEIASGMGFRVLDAGPLSNASLLESLTPLILNIMRASGISRELTVRFV
ncbi:MAG: NADPH-dependent F420 reductase [Archaeoglobaceae archaeon]